jgi:cAMP-dependent protein kinase regulator
MEKKLRDYVPGEAFGELALLYNAPRAATIRAVDECTLFELDRQTFNNIVKDVSRQNRKKYEEFLKSVQLLSSMDYYERVSLCDAVRKVKFDMDDYIIKEGEEGDAFYFVIAGTAVAQKEIDGVVKNIKDYTTGDYFGERALLTNEPRAASIIATSEETVLAKLELRSFKRLLGPVENILKRNMKEYSKVHED